MKLLTLKYRGEAQLVSQLLFFFGFPCFSFLFCLMKFTKIFKLLLTSNFLLGIVTGKLQHKDTKRCVYFGDMRTPPSGTCRTFRGPFRWCINHFMKLDTSNCATVSLETNGRRKSSGRCVHMYQERDVFKV